MSRRYTIDQWRRAVVRDPHLSDATRVLLLVMADSMTTDLRVSVTREELARRLARSERRVSERLAEAIGEKKGTKGNEGTCRLEHRLLDRVTRGQKHVAAAVYQALVPEYLSGTHVCPPEITSQGDGTEPPENDENRPPEKRGHRPQGDTRGSRITSGEPLVRGLDRNKRSKGEVGDPGAEPHLKVDDGPCQYHGFTRCDDDCADHPAHRERSA